MYLTSFQPLGRRTENREKSNVADAVHLDTIHCPSGRIVQPDVEVSPGRLLASFPLTVHVLSY